MRIHALLIAMVLAIGATSSTVLSQVKREDGGSGTVKGQSEHPKDPKHVEPESSSHNADKPKNTPTTTSPSTPSGSPEKDKPDPATKK